MRPDKEKRRAHNLELEQSPEFQEIEHEVDKEVYTQFALERIKEAERDLAEHGDYIRPECDFDFEFGDEPKSPDEIPLVSGIDCGAIERYEKYLRKQSNRIEEAKRMLEMYPDEPEHAARLFMQLGSCHWIWVMKKSILQEKYGITWYSPAELNPDVIYD